MYSLFTMIKNAVTTPSSVLAYDSQPFFSAAHPVGPLAAAGDTRDSTASNINTTGTGPYWYLLDASRVVRPFIFQLRREYAVTRMNTLTDEGVFNRREFRFGVDARANTGVGLWQLAYAANTDLSNPTNYGAARAAMRSIKTDAGLPSAPSPAARIFTCWCHRSSKRLPASYFIPISWLVRVQVRG